jgi:hypothetical protein
VIAVVGLEESHVVGAFFRADEVRETPDCHPASMASPRSAPVRSFEILAEIEIANALSDRPDDPRDPGQTHATLALASDRLAACAARATWISQDEFI